ncbi:3-hydroxyacyl-CoA dehydrogenase NAD-binding domain-containing protein [[Eubacterium] cellulosolvens]
MNINNIACIGAGTIGYSWATLFAVKGCNVSIYDVNIELSKNSLKNIKAGAAFLADKGLIERRCAETVLDRIRITEDMSECVAEADYIQESIFESYDVKKKAFSEIGMINSESIIASSTSGLLMSKIQKNTKKPERCIVAHPWNPPLLLKLVELVPGENTSQQTIRKTYEFMEDLGKIPVIVKREIPGFIGNRLQAALWREALNIIEKGIATVEDVDRVICAGPGARWAIMGPFLTFHLGGGPGGIEYLIDNIQESMSGWYNSMDDWKSIPYHAAKKAIEEVKQLPKVKENKFEKLVEWRDNKLVKILKIQEDSNREDGPVAQHG